MDGSPRSSKRRKLEAPARSVSSPLAKGSLKRASGRIASRTTSIANGNTSEDELSPLQSSKAARSDGNTPYGTLRKRALKEKDDVYDDIDGAFGEESVTPEPVIKSRKTPRRSGRGVPAEDQVEAGTTEEKVDGISLALRESLHKLKHKPVAGAKSENELELKPVATSRRKGTRAASARANGTPAKASETPSNAKTRIRETAEEFVSSTTPSKLRSNRKAAASARSTRHDTTGSKSINTTAATPSKKRNTIQDSEDELGDRATPIRGYHTVKDRRKQNRADNTRNQEESAAPDSQNEDDAAQKNGYVDDHISVDGGSILDPTEPSPFNPKPIPQEKVAARLFDGEIPPGKELDLLKSIVLERLTAKRPAPLVGLNGEYKTVHQLVEHTITAGEGNSMLLIGSRGSGKTALVNKVLTEVVKDNSEDFHTVRLNGFIHTDDKIALREIWRQLGKEMDLEDDGGLGKNYADTLTTLLALLSHPSEQTGELTEQVAKAVIFIMDEFDLFASHPRQTLLYNLFDIAQSRKAPIAVLGLTTRIDIANSLEKRVKSRFSHRYVHLSPAKTFSAFQEICKASLLVQPEDLSVEERAILSSIPTPVSTNSKKGAAKDKELSVLAQWNANINSLFTSKDFLTQHLAPHFYHTKSPSAVLTSFLLPVSTLTTALSAPGSSTSLAPPDSKLTIIPSLSTLALSLLISAARLDIIHDSDTCNFNMAYDEYVSLASKARIQSAAGGLSASGAVAKVWGKEAARREWEGLIELGLVMQVIGGGSGGFGMCKVDVSLEEVGMVIEGRGERGLERWCKQL